MMKLNVSKAQMQNDIDSQLKMIFMFLTTDFHKMIDRKQIMVFFIDRCRKQDVRSGDLSPLDPDLCRHNGDHR